MSAPSQGFERICDQPNTRSTLLALSCCFYSVAPTQGTVRARPCRPIARIPSPSAALLAKYANTPGRRPRRARRDLDWRDEQSHHCARRRCSSCPLRKSEVVPDRLPRPRTAGPTQPNGRWQRRPRPTANFAGKPASHPDKHPLSQFALPHSSHRAWRTMARTQLDDNPTRRWRLPPVRCASDVRPSSSAITHACGPPDPLRCGPAGRHLATPRGSSRLSSILPGGEPGLKLLAGDAEARHPRRR